ncbi:MAG: hypothetical protein E7578_05305 [Ruminococcaceae bacterium]|nr:hypothetical protein [Oscillospiraceae bacterium]
MKHSKLLSLILCVATVISGLVYPVVAESTVTSADFTAEELDCSSYDIRKYTEPFWEGNIVYNEIVHPIRAKNGYISSFPLMYKASEIVSVKDYKLKKTYVEGVDYMLVAGTLCILETGSIPVMDWEDMHPTSVPAGYGSDEFAPYYPHADTPNQWEYWTGGSDVCSMSLAVTYIHNDTWKAPVPESQESNLPKTFEKLKNDEPLHIVVAGDSVAAGAMSSGFFGMPPYAEAYPEMTLRALREKYSNDNITLTNSAIGGTMSTFEQSKMDSTIISKNPDLVIINFGMNDSSCDRVGISGAQFRSNIQQQINYIKQKLPNCEVLLLSSLYGNRYTFPAERYEEHAAVLHELAAANSGVGVADPQRIEKYLIEETGKDFICFQADNMVHPGDLGMRLTTQTILEALSFENPSTYRDHLISELTAYADIDNQDETKREELTAILEDAKAKMALIDEEWDLNAVADEAFYEMKVVIIRCDVHSYVDEIIEPTCKTGGYTHSVCSACGHKYDHSFVSNLGGEHVMDSGRTTVKATAKSPGETTYSCARCPYTETEVIPVLTTATTYSTKGMIHFSNSHNYLASDLQPYTNGSGFVEFDFCPINIEKFDGTPYVGVWFSDYTITACYNFAAQEVQIIKTSLPFGGGTVYASADYAWTSNGGRYEYNWKKFAVHCYGKTVRIYIDGELVLEDTDVAYSAYGEVALIYSNGECYMDNIKVMKGSYDPTTGLGGTTLGSWDINSKSSYNSFFSAWTQSYATRTFTYANTKNVTTGHYPHTTHSGLIVGVIPNDCANSGYNQYSCDKCGETYFNSYTDPLYDEGHTLINQTVTKEPTATEDGEYSYECSTCTMKFTQIIPKGTDLGGDDETTYSKGDVNNDGNVNSSDTVILRRHFTGSALEIDMEAADFNSDGDVNSADLVALARWLVS